MIMNEKREVEVHITGRPDGAEEIVTKARGRYYNKAGTIHIIYDENFEGDDSARNHLILDKKQVRIRKTGAVEVNMMFEEGLVHNTVYKTCGGQIPVSIESGSLKTDFHEKGIDISLFYKLIFEDMEPVDNILNLKISYLPEEDYHG